MVKIAQAGNSETELGQYRFLPTDPVTLRRELEKSGFSLCSPFIETHLEKAAKLDTGIAAVLISARLIAEGRPQLLIPSDKITPACNGSAGRRPLANSLAWSEFEWRNAVDVIREIMT